SQQIFDLDAGIPNGSALISGWQEAGTVVLGATVGEPRSDGHKARQTLILSAQTIGNPGTHTGTRKSIRAGVQLKDGAAVGDTISHQGSDHANVINARSHRGE